MMKQWLIMVLQLSQLDLCNMKNLNKVFNYWLQLILFCYLDFYNLKVMIIGYNKELIHLLDPLEIIDKIDFKKITLKN